MPRSLRQWREHAPVPARRRGKDIDDARNDIAAQRGHFNGGYMETWCRGRGWWEMALNFRESIAGL